MLSVIHMQVRESERRMAETRSAAHRCRIVAMAQEARNSAQQDYQEPYLRPMIRAFGAKLQRAYQVVLALLAGLPPRDAAWGW